MRTLILFAMIALAKISAAHATDVDYAKLATAERSKLAKCFGDILTVVERYRLGHVLDFLEAGCVAEMRNYRAALRPSWSEVAQKSDEEKWFAEHVKDNDLPQLFKSIINRAACQSTCMNYPTTGSTMLIASMEENALNYYNSQTAVACSGNGCAIEAYDKCILTQSFSEIAKRTEPRNFEKVIETKCMDAANTLRFVLTMDFTNAQRFQLDPDLTGKTRDLINDIVIKRRHTAVVAYANDLAKVQPGRKSCEPDVCGDSPCISFEVEDEPEYKCAIGQ